MMQILITGGSGFIGTNLIDALLERRINFVNLDIKPPAKPLHGSSWQKCDILNFDQTMNIFEKFRPTHVVHLAARTDTRSNNLDDYNVNTDGTANILRCIKEVSSIQRVIMTSSQFVYGPPGTPQHDEDYKPIGAYGKSKVITEQFTRSARLNCAWTIVRPTNIWGPWHPRYPKEFWLVLKKRLYVQPGGKSAIRSYGYVGNIVYQILKILEASPALVDRKVYYLGDPPIRLLDWVDGFSMAIVGARARIVPRWFFKGLAITGSILGAFGVRFPIQLSRYRSMTEDYLSPIGPTIAVFGKPPYSLEDGINETVIWLKKYWDGELSY
jgi:nucleoside-diphosphate-sugar epimerase